MLFSLLLNAFTPDITKLETIAQRSGKVLNVRTVNSSTATRLQIPVANIDGRAEWRDQFSRRFNRIFEFAPSDAVLRAINDGSARVLSIRSGELAVMLSMVIDADAKDSIETIFIRYMGKRVRASVNTALAMRRLSSVPLALQFLQHPSYDASGAMRIVSGVRGGIRELFLAGMISLQSNLDPRISALARLYLDRLLPYSEATCLQVLQEHVIYCSGA